MPTSMYEMEQARLDKFHKTSSFEAQPNIIADVESEGKSNAKLHNMIKASSNLGKTSRNPYPVFISPIITEDKVKAALLHLKSHPSTFRQFVTLYLRYAIQSGHGNLLIQSNFIPLLLSSLRSAIPEDVLCYANGMNYLVTDSESNLSKFLSHNADTIVTNKCMQMILNNHEKAACGCLNLLARFWRVLGSKQTAESLDSACRLAITAITKKWSSSSYYIASLTLLEAMVTSGQTTQACLAGMNCGGIISKQLVEMNDEYYSFGTALEKKVHIIGEMAMNVELRRQLLCEAKMCETLSKILFNCKPDHSLAVSTVKCVSRFCYEPHSLLRSLQESDIIEYIATNITGMNPLHVDVWVSCLYFMHRHDGNCVLFCNKGGVDALFTQMVSSIGNAMVCQNNLRLLNLCCQNETGRKHLMRLKIHGTLKTVLSLHELDDGVLDSCLKVISQLSSDSRHAERFIELKVDDFLADLLARGTECRVQLARTICALVTSSYDIVPIIHGSKIEKACFSLFKLTNNIDVMNCSTKAISNILYNSDFTHEAFSINCCSDALHALNLFKEFPYSALVLCRLLTRLCHDDAICDYSIENGLAEIVFECLTKHKDDDGVSIAAFQAMSLICAKQAGADRLISLGIVDTLTKALKDRYWDCQHVISVLKCMSSLLFRSELKDVFPNDVILNVIDLMKERSLCSPVFVQCVKLISVITYSKDEKLSELLDDSIYSTVTSTISMNMHDPFVLEYGFKCLFSLLHKVRSDDSDLAAFNVVIDGLKHHPNNNDVCYFGIRTIAALTHFNTAPIIHHFYPSCAEMLVNILATHSKHDNMIDYLCRCIISLSFGSLMNAKMFDIYNVIDELVHYLDTTENYNERIFRTLNVLVQSNPINASKLYSLGICRHLMKAVGTVTEPVPYFAALRLSQVTSLYSEDVKTELAGAGMIEHLRDKLTDIATDDSVVPAVFRILTVLAASSAINSQRICFSGVFELVVQRIIAGIDNAELLDSGFKCLSTTLLSSDIALAKLSNSDLAEFLPRVISKESEAAYLSSAVRLASQLFSNYPLNRQFYDKGMCQKYMDVIVKYHSEKSADIVNETIQGVIGLCSRHKPISSVFKELGLCELLIELLQEDAYDKLALLKCVSVLCFASNDCMETLIANNIIDILTLLLTLDISDDYVVYISTAFYALSFSPLAKKEFDTHFTIYRLGNFLLNQDLDEDCAMHINRTINYIQKRA